jgi:PPP family 3-phenylpropionic acid transporter
MRIFGPNLWGWVADHTRRRVLVLRLTSIAAVCVFTGMFWGESFAYFFALLILLNLFTSAQGPLSEAQMLSAMRGDLTHYGRLRLWGSVGFIVAVMVSGQLLDAFGIAWMPTIALLLLLLVVVAAAGMREETQPTHPQAMPSVSALLREREVIAFLRPLS